MHFGLTMIAGFAVAFGWTAIWDLLLGMPITYVRPRAKDRIKIRERATSMGQPRYVALVGVLRSGIAFGLAMVTFDLGFDAIPRDWHVETVKFVFLSLTFGVITGASGWDSAVHDKSAPPPLVK